MKPIILPLLGLILTLSILTGFTPRILPNVHGASGVLNPVTNWSPLGPREQNLVLKIYSQYSDSLDALADFGSGKLDIVDVPVSAASIPGVSCTNPEFVCTSPIGAQGDQYPALRGWDFSSVPPGTQSSIVSVANHGFQTGSGFWSLLNMRQLPDFDACKIPGAPSNCSVYQPGAGDETIRRSITQPPNGLAQLSPFFAHTPGELEVLSLVYDSMLQVNPMTVEKTTSSYRVFGSPVTVPPGAAGSATVTCNPGDFATSGGDVQLSSPNSPLLIYASTPAVSGGGYPYAWTVSALNPSVDSGASLQAVVICMSPVSNGVASLSTHVQVGISTLVPPGARGTALASCGSEYTTGGGFMMSGFGNNGILSEAYLGTGGISGGWTVSAYNPSALVMRLSPLAVCLNPIIPGISTYTVVGPSVATNPGSTQATFGSCRPGDFATGGGSISPGPTLGTPMLVVNSEPTYAGGGGLPAGWRTDSFNPTSSALSSAAVVVCMPRITGKSPGSQILDWMTLSHTSSFDPTEVSCTPAYGCVTGTTTQTWWLRPDVHFQRYLGKSPLVTGLDVAYTIMAYRDVPSVSFGPLVARVSSAASFGPIVQVKLQQSDPMDELDIGLLPIIPASTWSKFCGVVPSPTSSCASPGLDPIVAGIFYGSGPWICRGPCTSSGTQIVQPVGSAPGSITLVRYDSIGIEPEPFGYMRCCPNVQDVEGSLLQTFSWADQNDNGVVDILDLVGVASSFGAFNSYYDHPLHSCFPVNSCGFGGRVGLSAVLTFFGYFDVGSTCPYCGAIASTNLLGLDPQIDSFMVNVASGVTSYYLGAKRDPTGNLVVELVILSGAPASSDFSVQTSPILRGNVHVWATPVTGTTGSRSDIVLVNLGPLPLADWDIRILYQGKLTPSSDWAHIYYSDFS